MKLLKLFLGMVFLIAHDSEAQPPVIQKLGREVFEAWTSVADANIDGHGTFISYTVNNEPKGSSSLIVKSQNSKRTKVLQNSGFGKFSSVTSELYYKGLKDSLFALNLMNFKSYYIDTVSTFQMLGNKWFQRIAYSPKRSVTSLCLLDLKTKTTVKLQNVINYTATDDGSELLLQVNNEKHELVLFNVKTGLKTKLWEGVESVSNMVYRKDLGLVAFQTDTMGNVASRRKLWIYNKKSCKLTLAVQQSKFSNSKYQLTSNRMEFSSNGEGLVFSMDTAYSELDNSDSVLEYFWRYDDKYLPTEHKFNYETRNVLLGIYNIEKEKVTIFDELGDIISSGRLRERFLLKPKVNLPWFEEKKNCASFSLYSVAEGSLKNIPYKICNSYLQFSPNDKCLVWFDEVTKQWLSYNIVNEIVQCLTSAINVPLYDCNAEKSGRKGPWGIAGWIPTENALLIYDEFDIWKVSLNNSFPPVNVTSGEGRKSGVTLTITPTGTHGDEFVLGQRLVLTAYDRKTKNGGYFKILLGKEIRLPKDHLFPYSVHSRMPVGVYWTADGTVKKAENADVYIVTRETAAKSNNVFFTKNFKNYEKISTIAPELGFNWLAANLINWKNVKGECLQGILYKPGNFDSSKKYPVIVNYYEKRSDELHKFLKPGFSEHNLNIPTFVDNGYLVFVPDVQSVAGEIGDGTLMSIESGVLNLMKLPYVDKARIGIQGHSYGGWQTNYLITHSKLFAAACEASGVSDQISAYGQLSYGRGSVRQFFYEFESQGAAYGFGNTPWTRPDLYIKNSPIFKVGDIITPLLMAHNKDDGSVPFEQAVEFFTALRRAGKKVWLLQYKDGNSHWFFGKASEDYHNRMMQFFNHYLKGDQKPVWMAEAEGPK